MVTVYTTENCAACDSTKKWLERRGIPYRLEWLKGSMAAMELAQAHGYKAAPVVVAGSLSCYASPFAIESLIPTVENLIPTVDNLFPSYRITR
ncbi:unnamed protein product [Oppiella nova]|uniref:Glutaredoxin domain-containing protein n=1 Tax=Oppiella nova TaxID=334625 RepID=A0A7R9M477_9ACAR|nr:unnamed protein product [Oppiella nova]CAG2170481.1 unnamed protein product [Oppiella nova]